MAACAAAFRLWQGRAAALLLVVTAAALASLVVPSQAVTAPARATWYDDNGQGSCHFAPADVPSYYAAWPDSQENAPACGKCFEVSCVDGTFQDGYGATIDRTSACYDTTKSVVVKIVDSCPCIHANYYSNQRWCCGDMRHIDLGRAAFQQLAPEGVGVIGIQYREVDCSQLGVGSIAGTLPPSASTSSSASTATSPLESPAPSAVWFGQAVPSLPPPPAQLPSSGPAAAFAAQPQQQGWTAWAGDLANRRFGVGWGR